MATYAIGDVQGCFAELSELLSKINFSEHDDQLWFCGDLVNRGPDSVNVLRLIKQLGHRATTVLGNHDLHLLAIAYGSGRLHRKDTMQDIFSAHDHDELLDWLRHQPLFHEDLSLGYCMLHAGVAPQWGIDQIRALSNEVHAALRSDQYKSYLDGIYGNQPDRWDESLKGIDRLRCITNFFTRLRYCDQNGVMDFQQKGPPESDDSLDTNIMPWYQVPNRASTDQRIIFGHWSTHYLRYPDLQDPAIRAAQVYPLDTGCLWGGELTALRLEDEHVFAVQSHTAHG